MLRAAVQSDQSNERLSQIRTNWSQLFAAAGTTSESASEAQKSLLLDYSGAVFRYLLGALKNEHTASDLAQEFAVRFLRGDFRSVAPEKGRFRDFLKRTLCNLVNDHFRRQMAEQRRVQSVAHEEKFGDDSETDRLFDEDWVIEVLRRAWNALEEDQKQNNTQYYNVLRARAESPELNSKQLCESLSKTLANPALNEAWVRQNVSRARKLFARLLYSEVEKTLKDATPESVEEELAALGLLKYCK